MSSAVPLDATPDPSGRVILLRDRGRGVFIPDDVLIAAGDDPNVLQRAAAETMRHRYREHRTTCPGWSPRPVREWRLGATTTFVRRRERQRERRIALAADDR